ncbi:hypothetical protein DFA_06716 [Cavenderia fasciculata]|uniref:Secreted protein n=1 Tax=Cavenderia fasciculata TaxID=261658 RepID=F4Q229_CACFS|nr:uncharacterized protein DFA_06716 [Cavenderia fasciculata]EGG18049.1 hypothetical protein DFA_06716 [Cavenderia fasciculata]|eukprot:XP_004356942.1 hypothetical protein DFA_06716 [Cavenderia fasciculata]
MKFFNTFIVASLMVAICLKSYVDAVTYLQMVPYADPNCTESDGSYGVGFSFQVGQCMGVGDLAPGAQNIYVSVNNDETIATISSYKNYDPTCEYRNPNGNSTWVVGGCYRAPAYANIGYKVTNNFVRVSIVDNPSYVPLYGFKQAVYSDRQCSSDPQWYYYYTNGTVFHWGTEYSQTFYCEEYTSIVVTCNGTASQPSCASYNVNQGCSRDVWNLHEHNYYLNSC